MIILGKSEIKRTIIYLIIASVILAIVFFMDRNNDGEVKTTSANTSGEGYEILVDVEDSLLYLIQDNQTIKIYKCSGGKWSTPSPIGTWEITEKDTWGEGFRRKVDGIKCTLG